MCFMRMPKPTEFRRGLWNPGTGVTGGCELLCGFRELKPSLLHSAGAVSTHNHGVPHLRGIRLGKH